MPDEQMGLTVTLRCRLAKFDGEGTDGPPVEVIETEETVPLASLPLEVQQHLFRTREEA